MIKQIIYRIIPRGLRIFIKRMYFSIRNDRTRFGIINIETTTYCNLRCKFCPNSKYERGLLKNKQLMTDYNFKKIINELSDNNYSGTISLQLYGEPLSDDRICEFVKYARTKCPSSRITINSNGFLLTNSLYKELVEAGVDDLLISQYTPTIQPNYVSVTKFINDNGLKNIITYRVLDGSIGSDAIYNRGGEIESPRLPDLPSCVYPVKVVHVNYKGEVIICCNDYHSSVVLGDTNKENLYDIWKSDRYCNLRKELDNFDFKYDLCKRCIGEKK